MKKWALTLFALLTIQHFAYANTYNIKRDDLPTCKEKLTLLQIIADERCRVVPASLSHGTSYPLEFLHRNVCEKASEAVITQAQECLILASI